jgi:hypothetical protein
MQLRVTGEESPIFRELLEEWQRKREAQPESEPEQHDSFRSRVYRRVTNWLKGPEAKPEKVAAYRPTHRRTAYA